MGVNIQGLFLGVLLLASIALIIAGIIMYWAQICFGENCLKQTRKTSIVLGLMGWILLVLVIIPPII